MFECRKWQDQIQVVRRRRIEVNRFIKNLEELEERKDKKTEKGLPMADWQ